MHDIHKNPANHSHRGRTRPAHNNREVFLPFLLGEVLDHGVVDFGIRLVLGLSAEVNCLLDFPHHLLSTEPPGDPELVAAASLEPPAEGLTATFFPLTLVTPFRCWALHLALYTSVTVWFTHTLILLASFHLTLIESPLILVPVDQLLFL